MKRILALLLCFCLCVSLIPAAFAEDADEIIILDEDFLEGVELDTDVDVDDLIDIIDPEAVQPPADEPMAGLPASGDCGDDLTWYLTEGGSLTISGTGEMYDYEDELAPWREYESDSFHIQNITLEEGVTTVGTSAFSWLESVSAISLPSTLRTIGDYAFIGLNIHTLSLPEGLLSIGMHAFRSCDNIFSVTIPASLTSLGKGAFSGCGSLSIFSVTSGSTAFQAIDNVLFSKDGKTLAAFPEGYGNTMAPGAGATGYEIPSGTVKIGPGAFMDNGSLEQIELPDTLTEIDGWAFTNCGNLTTVSGGTNLKTIGDAAFRFSGITEIGLPDGLETIGDAAFNGCGSLTSFSVPEGVTCLGWSAFGGCKKLQSISLPYSLTEIAYGCFEDCSSLIYVQIPKNVVKIGKGAFSDCSKLTQIDLFADIQTIPRGMFKGCVKLAHVVMPSSLTEIAYGAFEGCLSLQHIYLPQTLETIEVCAFKDSGLLTAEMPDSVSEVMTEAFMGCEDLEYVVFGSGLTELGEWVFSGCDKLDRVYFTGKTPVIDDEAFLGFEWEGDSTYPVSVIAWYPSDIGSWPSSSLRNYGGAITWVPYTNNLFIKEQPKDKECYPGAFVEFSVHVGCAADTVYEWQYKTADALSGSWKTVDFAPSNMAQVNFYATQDMDGSIFRCKITGNGLTIYSDTVRLNVITPDAPVITTQPTSKTAKEGTTANFTVAASGAESYQWQYRTSSTGTWYVSTLTGAKTPTLPVPATMGRNGYQYRCKISNAEGYVLSDIATLTVVKTPEITTQPKSITAPAGDTVTFKVAATGGGLSYQWQYRKNSSDTWKISGSTGNKTATLTLTATEARNGFQFRCKVTNAADSALSEIATLTVLTKPVITTQPTSKTAKEGTTAKFTVAANGATSYQWQYRTSSTGTWYISTLTGAKTATLSVPATAGRNGYQYRCKVTNAQGSVLSEIATLTVLTKPVLTTQPSSKTVKEGATAKFTVAANGATSYQWQYRTSSSGTWYVSTLTGAKTATLSVPATKGRNGYQYRCKVTNEQGSVLSEIATLTVLTKPVITTQPTSKTAPAGDTVKFKVAATGDGLSYQWQYRKNSSDTWKISGSTGNKTATLTLTATEARSGFQFRCKITNAAGNVLSETATLTVLTKPVITTQPASKTATAGDTVSFKVTATGDGLSYQWQYRTSSTGAWYVSTLTGAKTATLSVPATAGRNGYQYRCKITNAAGETFTYIVTLTVK